MGFWSIFSRWPKRLPEGETHTVQVAGITVFLCGKNHHVLDQKNREGAAIWHNDYLFLKGYRRKDGKLTIHSRIGWRVAGYELQHLLNYADKEIVNPDVEM